MAKHAVVIAGGGPTGMMLAAELALAQVDVVIVERRATPDPDRSRAGGLHARTIEVLDQRGVADRFLEEGKAMQIQGFGRIPLDISDFIPPQLRARPPADLHTSEPTLQDVSEALIAADGTDYGVHSLSWTSRFTDNTRQAASYRTGRILLAGDAAHVHPPLGGQGLRTPWPKWH
jgi:2-polyprenyl-6-methoxyphenol hydroxylase-like FAD-dependent oxidoreductase